jgi:hypothetical protein
VACWADVIGGCGKGLTLEHVFSQAVFNDTMLTVTGTTWASSPKRVSLAGLGSKMLCGVHNNGSSRLDSAAGKLITAVRDFAVGSDAVVATLSGWDLEAWLLKTTINLFASGWATARTVQNPPKELVEVVFGRRTLPADAGTFVADNHSAPAANEDFRWITLVDESTHSGIVGAMFSLRGVLMVLAATGGNPQGLIRRHSDQPGFPLSQIQLKHRPKTLMLTGDNRKLIVKLDWSPQRPLL